MSLTVNKAKDVLDRPHAYYRVYLKKLLVGPSSPNFHWIHGTYSTCLNMCGLGIIASNETQIVHNSLFPRMGGGGGIIVRAFSVELPKI